LLLPLDIRLEVLALRERPEIFYCNTYWEHKSRELGRGPASAEALCVLEGYTWPGNVRELLNVVERLLVASTKPVIEPTDLPSSIQAEGAGRLRRFPLFHLGTVVAEAERRTLERALHQAQGNRNKAAQLVGLSRASFYRKLKAYSLLQGDREMLAFRAPL
jgi:DNA-binding NtrC family response regulator